MGRKKRRVSDTKRWLADIFYRPKERRARQLREEARQADRRVEKRSARQFHRLAAKRSI